MRAVIAIATISAICLASAEIGSFNPESPLSAPTTLLNVK